MSCSVKWVISVQHLWILCAIYQPFLKWNDHFLTDLAGCSLDLPSSLVQEHASSGNNENFCILSAMSSLDVPSIQLLLLPSLYSVWSSQHYLYVPRGQTIWVDPTARLSAASKYLPMFTLGFFIKCSFFSLGRRFPQCIYCHCYYYVTNDFCRFSSLGGILHMLLIVNLDSTGKNIPRSVVIITQYCYQGC